MRATGQLSGNPGKFRAFVLQLEAEAIMTTFETIFNNPSLPQTKSQRPSDRQKQDGSDLRFQGSAAKATFLINGNSYFCGAGARIAAGAAHHLDRRVGFQSEHPDWNLINPTKPCPTYCMHWRPQIRSSKYASSSGRSAPSIRTSRCGCFARRSFPRNARIDLRFDLQRDSARLPPSETRLHRRCRLLHRRHGPDIAPMGHLASSRQR